MRSINGQFFLITLLAILLSLQAQEVDEPVKSPEAYEKEILEWLVIYPPTAYAMRSQAEKAHPDNPIFANLKQLLWAESSRQKIYTEGERAQKRNAETALKKFDEYLATTPHAPLAQFGRVDTQLFLKQQEAATTSLEALRATLADNPRFIALDARRLAEAKKVDEAIELCLTRDEIPVTHALFDIIAKSGGDSLNDVQKERIIAKLSTLSSQDMKICALALNAAEALKASNSLIASLTEKLLACPPLPSLYNPVKSEVVAHIEALYSKDDGAGPPEHKKKPAIPAGPPKTDYYMATGYRILSFEKSVTQDLLNTPNPEDFAKRGIGVQNDSTGRFVESAIIDLTYALRSEHQGMWFMHRAIYWLKLKKPQQAVADMNMGFDLLSDKVKANMLGRAMTAWAEHAKPEDLKFLIPILPKITPFLAADRSQQANFFAQRILAKDKTAEAELKAVVDGLAEKEQKDFWRAYVSVGGKVHYKSRLYNPVKPYSEQIVKALEGNAEALVDLVVLQFCTHNSLEPSSVDALMKASERMRDSTYYKLWTTSLWKYAYYVNDSEFQILKPLIPRLQKSFWWSESYLTKIFEIRIIGKDDPAAILADLEKAVEKHAKIIGKSTHLKEFMKDSARLIDDYNKKVAEEEARITAIKEAEKADIEAAEARKKAEDLAQQTLVNKAEEMAAKKSFSELVESWKENPGKPIYEIAVIRRLHTLRSDETWRLLSMKLRPEGTRWSQAGYGLPLPPLPKSESGFGWLEKVRAVIEGQPGEWDAKYRALFAQKMSTLVHPEMYRWRAHIHLRDEQYDLAIRDFKLAFILFDSYGLIDESERIDPWIHWADRLQRGNPTDGDQAFKELEAKHKVWGRTNHDDIIAYLRFYTGKYRGHFMAEAAINDYRFRNPNFGLLGLPLPVDAPADSVKKKIDFFGSHFPDYQAYFQAKGIESFQDGNMHKALEWMNKAAANGAGKYPDFYTARTLIHRKAGNKIDDYCDIISAFKGKPLTIMRLKTIFDNLEKDIANGNHLDIYNKLNKVADERFKAGDPWSGIYLNIFRLERLLGYHLKDKLKPEVMTQQKMNCNFIIASFYDHLNLHEETIKYAKAACEVPGVKDLQHTVPFLLANAYADSGRPQEGIRALKSLPGLDEFARIYYTGFLQTKTGEIAKAKANFDQVIDKQATQVNTALWAGEWMLKAKAYDEAAKYLVKGMQSLSDQDKKNKGYWKQQLENALRGSAVNVATSIAEEHKTAKVKPWEIDIETPRSYPMPEIVMVKSPRAGLDQSGADFEPATGWEKTPIGTFLKYQVEVKLRDRSKRNTLWQIITAKKDEGLVVTQIQGPPSWQAAQPPQPLTAEFRMTTSLLPYGRSLFAIPSNPQMQVEAEPMELEGWYTGGSDAGALMTCKRIKREVEMRNGEGRSAYMNQSWVFSPNVPFNNVLSSVTLRVVGKQSQTTDMRLQAKGILPPADRPDLIMLEEAASLVDIIQVTNYPDKNFYKMKLVEACGRAGALGMGKRLFPSDDPKHGYHKNLMKYAGASRDPRAWRSVPEDALAKAIEGEIKGAVDIDVNGWESLLERLPSQEQKDIVRAKIVRRLAQDEKLDQAIEQIEKVVNPEKRLWAIDELRLAARPENMLTYLAKAGELGSKNFEARLGYAIELRKTGKNNDEAKKQLEIAKTLISQHPTKTYQIGRWAEVIHEQLNLGVPTEKIGKSLDELDKLLKEEGDAKLISSIEGKVIELFSRLGKKDALMKYLEDKLNPDDMFWAWQSMAYATLGGHQEIVDSIIQRVSKKNQVNKEVNVDIYKAKIGMYQSLAIIYKNEGKVDKSNMCATQAYSLSKTLIEDNWLQIEQENVIDACGVAHRAFIEIEAFELALDHCDLIRSLNLEDSPSKGLYMSLAKAAKKKAPELARISIRRIHDDKSRTKAIFDCLRHLVRFGHEGIAKELTYSTPSPGARRILQRIIIEEQSLFCDIENARRSLQELELGDGVAVQVAMLAMATREAKEGNWKRAREYVKRANDLPFKIEDWKRSGFLGFVIDHDIQHFSDMMVNTGRFVAMSGVSKDELLSWLASEPRLEYRAPLAYGMALGYMDVPPTKTLTEMLHNIKRK